MTRHLISLLITCFVFISMDSNAQNKKTTPCSKAEYKQFDFWLGNWNVYDDKEQLIGTNNIVKMTSACAIQENWVSKVSTNKGTSYNYYNATDTTWNQVWVDNTGYSLNLKGSYKNNRMTLRSGLVKSKKGDFYNQITWTKNSDHSVTQIWVIIDSNEKVVEELFRGNYKKILK